MVHTAIIKELAQLRDKQAAVQNRDYYAAQQLISMDILTELSTFLTRSLGYQVVVSDYSHFGVIKATVTIGKDRAFDMNLSCVFVLDKSSWVHISTKIGKELGIRSNYKSTYKEPVKKFIDPNSIPKPDYKVSYEAYKEMLEDWMDDNFKTQP